MTNAPTPSSVSPVSGRLLLGGVLAGLVVGAGLDVLTWLVARYGPAGEGWSLRGNGALIVPFGLGPVIVAGAWIGLVRHARKGRGWQALVLTGVLATACLVGSCVAVGRALPPGS